MNVDILFNVTTVESWAVSQEGNIITPEEPNGEVLFSFSIFLFIYPSLPDFSSFLPIPFLSYLSFLFPLPFFYFYINRL